MYQHNCAHLWQMETIKNLHDHSKDTLTSLLQHLKHTAQTLPLCQYVDSFAIDRSLEQFAGEFRKFKDVIILGTGGSSLGGQSLYTLADTPSTILHFHDNIDPHTFTKLFSCLDPKTTGVVAISKSGNTSETLMQLLVCLEQWQRQNLSLAEHFFIITESDNPNNAILEIAHAHAIPRLYQPPTIGGRFAAFTVVGLLPAMIAGLDVNAFMKGAKQVLSDVRLTDDPLEIPAIEGAYLQYLLEKLGYRQSVLMPYIDRLSIFALWYRQLWAESLGKGGLGTTPIRALGTVDQHSQLQLYLDGPMDKFFTVITQDHPKDKFKLNDIAYTHPAAALFKGKSMGQLLMAEQQATIDTLQQNQCPTRVIHLNELTIKNLGGLMMHYVLETIAMAHLTKVNPFDQPAVEKIKIKTREYLEQL